MTFWTNFVSSTTSNAASKTKWPNSSFAILTTKDFIDLTITLRSWTTSQKHFTVKPGFHYHSTRLVETRARQHAPCWRVMETGHPSTRAVNSGSGNRALLTTFTQPHKLLFIFQPDSYCVMLKSICTMWINDGICVFARWRHSTMKFLNKMLMTVFSI